MASPGVDFGSLVSRYQALSGTSQAEAILRVNQAYRRFARKSRAIREKVAIGNTVVGTNVYDLPPEVIHIFGVRVNGLAYDRKSPEEIDDLNASEAYSAGKWPFRYYAPEFTSSGGSQLLINPTPTTVMPVTVRAAVLPTDMSNVAPAGEYPKLPIDYHEDLIEGALALGLGRDDERFSDRQALLAEFDQRAIECGGQINSRTGSGVARVKLTR